MDDTYASAPPEVTIEPADNGFVVRHQQRSGKKDESSRTVRRVASSADEALDHARSAITGGGKSSKKKSTRSVGRGLANEAGEPDESSGTSPAPAAHTARRSARSSARRRRPRIGGRR